MGSVLVLGSLNMDFSIEVSRMPVAGETIEGTGLLVSPGGKGANQAVASARMGARTYMIGSVGTDGFGSELIDGLASAGVLVDEVHRCESDPTGMAVVLRSQGDNRIVIDHGANYAAPSPDMMSSIERVAKVGDVLLAQFERPLEEVFSTLQRAHELGLFVILNPSPAHEVPAEALGAVDMLCLNETEFEGVFGLSVPDADGATLDVLRQVVAESPLRPNATLVLTLGSRGSLVIDASGSLRHEAYAVDAIDTTCAGDTFVGTLAACHARGMGIERGLDLATAAAALATTRLGAQQAIPALEEVLAFESCNGREH